MNLTEKQLIKMGADIRDVIFNGNRGNLKTQKIEVQIKQVIDINSTRTYDVDIFVSEPSENFDFNLGYRGIEKYFRNIHPKLPVVVRFIGLKRMGEFTKVNLQVWCQ